jgi:hypothetical protein
MYVDVLAFELLKNEWCFSVLWVLLNPLNLIINRKHSSAKDVSYVWVKNGLNFGLILTPQVLGNQIIDPVNGFMGLEVLIQV